MNKIILSILLQCQCIHLYANMYNSFVHLNIECMPTMYTETIVGTENLVGGKRKAKIPDHTLMAHIAKRETNIK